MYVLYVVVLTQKVVHISHFFFFLSFFSALDQFIHAVYFSSIDKDIGACDFESLSEFICGREKPWQHTPWYHKLQAPIRAVNLGGLFVIERWITPNLFDWGKKTTGIVDQHSFSLQCHELGTVL